jgi:non-homologous end joining protein Ku
MLQFEKVRGRLMLVTVQPKNILFGMLASKDEDSEVLRKLVDQRAQRNIPDDQNVKHYRYEN